MKPRCCPSRSAVLLLGIGALLCLLSCASRPRAPEAAAADPVTISEVGQSPLSDFALGEDEIPEVLLQAVAETYRPPAPLECAVLEAEIAALDAILGPDLDRLKAADRTEDFVETAMVGALRSLIPYRSVIRFLSGARKRERRILEAIGAGAVRRGYLKGLGESIGCAPPAAPLPAPPPAEAGAAK